MPHTLRSRRRRVVGVVAAAALASVTLTSCGGSNGSSRDADPSRGSTASDLESKAPAQTEVSEQAQTGQPEPEADVPPAVSGAASDGADAFLDNLSGALRAPGGEVADGTLTGPALEALRAQAEEYERSGWRMTGRPKVLWVEVYEHTAEQMVVGACIDNSRVKVVDQSGKVVSDGSETPPTLNILTLLAEGDGWVVNESSFPADPDC